MHFSKEYTDKKGLAYLLEIGLHIILFFNLNNLTEMVNQIQLPCILLIDFLHIPSIKIHNNKHIKRIPYNWNTKMPNHYLYQSQLSHKRKKKKGPQI